MAKFDASQVLEPLEYDFNPYVDIKGTIPEPDDKQIASYHRAMREEIKQAMKSAGASTADMESMTSEQFLKVLENTDQTVEEVLVINRRAAKIYSDLCSNALTQAQLMKVPPRIRIRFFSWLQKEVIVPEESSGAGNVRPLRRASAATG